mgnify:FL=1
MAKRYRIYLYGGYSILTKIYPLSKHQFHSIGPAMARIKEMKNSKKYNSNQLVLTDYEPERLKNGAYVNSKIILVTDGCKEEENC